MLVSRGVPAEKIVFVGTNEKLAVDIGNALYPEKMIYRLGAEQHDVLRFFLTNGQFIAWLQGASQTQDDALVQLLGGGSMANVATTANFPIDIEAVRSPAVSLAVTGTTAFKIETGATQAGSDGAKRPTPTIATVNFKIKRGQKPGMFIGEEDRYGGSAGRQQAETIAREAVEQRRKVAQEALRTGGAELAALRQQNQMAAPVAAPASRVQPSGKQMLQTVNFSQMNQMQGGEQDQAPKELDDLDARAAAQFAEIANRRQAAFGMRAADANAEIGNESMNYEGGCMPLAERQSSNLPLRSTDDLDGVFALRSTHDEQLASAADAQPVPNQKPQQEDSAADGGWSYKLPSVEEVKQQEEKAKRDAEERRKEAEDTARKEAEDRARKEAEDRVRQEAEDRARKEAEDRARKEAEDRVRQEAEERAKEQEIAMGAASTISMGAASLTSTMALSSEGMQQQREMMLEASAGAAGGGGELLSTMFISQKERQAQLRSQQEQSEQKGTHDQAKKQAQLDKEAAQRQIAELEAKVRQLEAEETARAN
jgi:hypothetical protein